MHLRTVSVVLFAMLALVHAEVGAQQDPVVLEDAAKEAAVKEAAVKEAAEHPKEGNPNGDFNFEDFNLGGWSGEEDSSDLGSGDWSNMSEL